MNKTVTVVFVALGGMFVLLVLVGMGFYISMLSSSSTIVHPAAPATAVSSDTSDSPADEAERTELTLTDNQQQALRSLGIDPASVRSSISAE